ncbi:2,3,4,5-tetrahydropyridine-2,6-dicarboxylate N-succinyltransferase [Candidatus Hepatincolaceae symbiont of Richtersius coronifer]
MAKKTIAEHLQMHKLDLDQLKWKVGKLWENKSNFPTNKVEVYEAQEIIIITLQALDQGLLSVMQKEANNKWQVNIWIKQAILLSFIFLDNQLIKGNSNDSFWFDKVRNKFATWQQLEFQEAKIRTVPQSYVRFSAFIGANSIIMPSFINVGAYVNEGVMIDSYATIGSCCYIGKKCHISSGVVIGGVLEPLQAAPVVIEDYCFVGANSTITEGIIIKEGSVIGNGVHLSGSTKIYDRQSKNIYYGEVPAFSVVVSGSLPHDDGTFHTNAAIIIKKVDEKTKEKTSINELLRA